MKIAAIILTNKSKVNYLLLQSLSLANEILIVVDSTNRGGEFSYHSNKKVKVLYHPLNSDFAAQRNFALEQTKADWILFVDDDEYVGTELQKEILASLQNPRYSGYYIPRRDVVFHQPLLHGETGNVKILRLGRRNAGKFVRAVHEIWKIKGRVGEMTSPLYHRKDHFISEFSSRMGRYGSIDAKILKNENKPFSWFRLFINPLAKFILNYFLKAGFLDVTTGLFLAYLMAIQSLSVRVFQWENLQK